LFNSIYNIDGQNLELKETLYRLNKIFSFGALYVQISTDRDETYLFTSKSSQLSILFEYNIGAGKLGPTNILGSAWENRYAATTCDDPIASEPYFASFLGTKITAVEIIHVREIGRRGMRANERGIRFTNDAGRQFTIGYDIGTPDTRGGMNILKPDEINPALVPRMTFTKL